MHCIFCGNKDTDVVETRTSDDGMTVRRRRECSKCVKRFTTYERVEQLPIIVVKRDGRRERFEIVNNVESDLKQEDTTEVESQKIGENVAKYLKKLDKIAYIRFASVFRRFVDVEDFEKEVKKLL